LKKKATEAATTLEQGLEAAKLETELKLEKREREVKKMEVLYNTDLFNW
jgi:hypothetical protein